MAGSILVELRQLLVKEEADKHSGEPDLSIINSVLVDMAREKWDSGDIEGVLSYLDNTKHLTFLSENYLPLIKAGLYERALLSAYMATRTNHHYLPLQTLHRFFEIADRERMVGCGDPLPPAPYTLYRGVCGTGRNRKVRGISWTADKAVAEWFANRYPELPGSPAVYEITLRNAQSIWAYTNEREEQEYYVLLPSHIKPKLVWGNELISLTHR